MRKYLVLIYLCFTFGNVQAQQPYADSLKNVFLHSKEDSTKCFALDRLSYYYSYLYPDSALYYADTLIKFSEKQNYLPGKAMGYVCKGEAIDRVASYPEALEAAYQGLEIAKTLNSHRLSVMGRAYSLIGHLNNMTGNRKEALGYFHSAIRLLEASNEFPEELCLAHSSMAFCMYENGNTDSALYYIREGNSILKSQGNLKYSGIWFYLFLGNVYMNNSSNIDSAGYYFREGIKENKKSNLPFIEVILYNSFANFFYKKKEMDSCIYYAQKSLTLCQTYKYKNYELVASNFLSRVYDKINIDSAYKYIKIMVAANNEINDANRVRQFQKVATDVEKKERELKDAKTRFQNSLKLYGLITLLSFFVLIAIIFWRNNRHRRKANALLTQKTEKLEQALTELKSTQAQLIQSEKMASLGELTAGIAHEIQNPLNFVNNFSDVNRELLTELKDEMDKGNTEEAKAIANDVIENEQKINHHGKRADAIVKGMLQHSRKSTGQKEPTDINALCDEYLRLAYHGLRAKDKNFNAEFKTDFESILPKVNVVSQDIGRVLLNLINNAFYAVNEKKKSGIVNYEPTVSISTKKLNGKVEVKVSDNGNGIPKNIVDKIFQPFFTTKPTGSGTGLGLSLSYDIIKAHGGEIKVNTIENEETEFKIQLPFN